MITILLALVATAPLVAQLPGALPLREDAAASEQTVEAFVSATLDASADSRDDHGGTGAAPTGNPPTRLRRLLRQQRNQLRTGIDPALSMSSDWRVDLRKRNAMREVLGENRWRHLEEARFYLHVREIHPSGHQMGLREVPFLYEQAEGSLRSNFGKLTRDYVEKRFGLDRLIERTRNRLRPGRAEKERFGGGFGLDLSPRIDIGDDPSLGLKLRARGNPFLSRVSFGAKTYLESDKTKLNLLYEHGAQRIYLEQMLDDPVFGSTFTLSVKIGL